MSRPLLLLKSLAVFALQREKDTRRKERTWVLHKAELAQTMYQDLRGFVQTNLAGLVNRPETPFQTRATARSPNIGIPIADARAGRSAAYLVKFKSSGSKRDLLETLIDSRGGFEGHADVLADAFLTTQNWPRCYLFVATFEVLEDGRDIPLLGVLTAELVHGSFVEDPKRIVEQLKRAVIGETVKKGVLFPHLVRKDNGTLATDSWVKVFEESSSPAHYFYDFLGIAMPKSAEEAVSDLVEESIGQGGSRLLRRVAEQIEASPGLAGTLAVDIGIDGLKLQVPLQSFRERVRFLSLPNGQTGVLFAGDSVSCHLSDRDLFALKAVEVLPWRDLKDAFGG